MRHFLWMAILILFSKCGGNDSACDTSASFGEITISEVGKTFISLNGAALIDICAGNASEKGIVYSTSENPTIADTKLTTNKVIFTKRLEGLEAETTYYIKQFLTYGGRTSYSEQAVVTTLAGAIAGVCTQGDYIEADGKLVVEMESAIDKAGWDVETSASGYSGAGYLVWNGSQSFNEPNQGLIDYKLNFTTTGTYKFVWNSRVTKGNNGTEHNDSWLSFPDVPAGDFYGKKGNGSIVYPKGLGLTPVPEGGGKSGFFKIYKSGAANEWKWQASTSDNDGHAIYLEIKDPGVYTMRIAARSSNHAIDKFVLHLTSIAAPTGANEPLSAICE
ncbi:hypothetical protein [Flavicella sediminum]|uniref:hypothetical protein n=1 Tax=Flavicella sediminum TaxID=2585141 RepID=UPI00111D4251|nr:hypothetical protein [Flavicella sediminum]